MIRRDEILPLTGLRGIAALLVVAHHAEGATLADRTQVFFRGQPWVDLFFILSGYVLTLVYLSKGAVDYRAFYVARFSRIYPLYFISAVFMVFAASALPVIHGQGLSSEVNAGRVIQELTLITALPYIGSRNIWNYPAWSVAIEWWVYLSAFPLLAKFGGRFSSAFWAAVSFAGIIILAFWLFSLPADAYFMRGWPAVLRGLVGFVAGYSVRRFEEEHPNARMPSALHDIIAVAIIAIIYISPPFIGYRDCWFVMILFPVLIWGCLNANSRSVYFLSTRAGVYLGLISYSVYLMHALIIFVWHSGAQHFKIESAELAVPICMVSSIVVSSFTFRLIEKPARRFLRRQLAHD